VLQNSTHDTMYPTPFALTGVGSDAAELPRPDAELIAICAEFIACDQQQRAIWNGTATDAECAAATAPIFARMEALLDQMEKIRAHTTEGIAARACSLAQHSGEWHFSFDVPDTYTGRLLDYLMRDAAALAKI
jgi:hypothetical protein